MRLVYRCDSFRHQGIECQNIICSSVGELRKASLPYDFLDAAQVAKETGRGIFFRAFLHIADLYAHKLVLIGL